MKDAWVCGCGQGVTQKAGLEPHPENCDKEILGGHVVGVYYVFIQHFAGHKLLSIVLSLQGSLGGNDPGRLSGIMLEGDGSSAASAGEYSNSIPIEQSTSQKSSAQSKPCKRLVDIATPMRGTRIRLWVREEV